jgi:DNA invertase Pin-like site-specific DNA recombinase
MGYLRAGDTLVVWRLDRLGRSLRHLVVALAERVFSENMNKFP